MFSQSYVTISWSCMCKKNLFLKKIYLGDAQELENQPDIWDCKSATEDSMWMKEFMTLLTVAFCWFSNSSANECNALTSAVAE